MVERPLRPENDHSPMEERNKVTKCMISGYHHKIGNITMGCVFNNLGYYLILYAEIKVVLNCLRK